MIKTCAESNLIWIHQKNVKSVVYFTLFVGNFKIVDG